MIDPATVLRIRTSFIGRKHALERLARLLGQERDWNPQVTCAHA